MKQVDFRRLEEKCASSKIEAIQKYILSQVKPGEKVEVILAKPDTWYAFTNLGEVLGYRVIQSQETDDGYRVVIKKEF